MKKEFKLNDGREVLVTDEIRPIPAKAFLDYINTIVKEDVFIVINKPYTLKEEKKWKKDALKGELDGTAIHLAATYDGRVVACLDARRGPFKQSDNVALGVSIAKEFRGKGLGEFMLRFLIQLVRERLKPKNIHLTVFADNKPALSLYRKVGFRKTIARYPKWFKHKGKYCDMLALLYTK
jgi:RimJ/RimL family protein N-acetyltransferase